MSAIRTVITVRNTVIQAQLHQRLPVLAQAPVLLLQLFMLQVEVGQASRLAIDRLDGSTASVKASALLRSSAAR